MAISINIGTTSTVKYRTDCFAPGYTDDVFFLRNGAGYKQVIAGAKSEDNHEYDVGYGGFPMDCIVYDGLLMARYFGVNPPHAAEKLSDIPYKQLLFQKPCIVIPSASHAINAYYRDIHLIEDTYFTVSKLYLKDELYEIQPGYDFYVSWIEGTKCVEGSQASYDGVFEVLTGYPGHPADFHIMGYPSWDSTAVCTQAELFERFKNTDQSFKIWEELDKYQYGAMVNCLGDSSSYPSLFVTVMNLIYCGWRGWQGDDGYTTMSIYYHAQSQFNIPNYTTSIIPFLSQDEFDAAYAANYRWDSQTIQQINEYLNN